MSRCADTAYQAKYFSDPAAKPRMAPSRTRYVLRHLEETCAAVNLESGMRVLELGAGRGRFSLLLLERDVEVTALDLSPPLLQELEARQYDGRLEVVCGDAAQAHRLVEGPFDAVLGFFFLHHLADLVPALAAARRLLRPGGRLAFCEPNGWSPLFYLQILLTPGMTWRGDGGVARMCPGPLARAFVEAGLESPRINRYGLFPPGLANTRLGEATEHLIEKARWLRRLLSFQVISSRRRRD